MKINLKFLVFMIGKDSLDYTDALSKNAKKTELRSSLLFIITILGTLIAFFKLEVAWYFFVVSFVAALLANIEILESFNFFGLKGKLKSTIREAEVTFDQLRELAMATTVPAINAIVYDGIAYREPVNINKKIESLQKIEEMLISLKVSKEEIDKLIIKAKEQLAQQKIVSEEFKKHGLV